MPRLVVASLLITMLGTPVAATAQGTDYSPILGDWEMTMETPRGTVTQVFSFAVDDGQLEGTVTTQMGQTRTITLQKVAFSEGHLTFDVERSFGDRTFTQSYSATVQGDELTGTVTGGRGGDRPFTAHRKQG